MSMPLTMAQAGVENTIRKISGKDEVRRFWGASALWRGARSRSFHRSAEI